MKQFKLFIGVYALLLVIAQAGYGMSMAPQTAGSLFEDPRANQIGDIVTVKVSESPRTRSSVAYTKNKEIEFGGEVNGGNTPKDGDHWWHNVARKIPLFGAKVSGKSDIKKGTNNQNLSTLTMSIATEIVSVMPNGNVMLKGKKQLVVGNDRVTMEFSGVARPTDIDNDNSIASSMITNAFISYVPEFTVNAKKKKSMFDKVLGPVMDIFF